MGNNTTVTTTAIGGAVATLIIFIIGAAAPDVLPDVAGLEAALAVIATALINYFTPAKA